MEVLRHADVDPLADARDLIVRHEAEHVCHVASFDAERSERLDEGVDRSPPVGDHLPRFQPGYVDVRYPGLGNAVRVERVEQRLSQERLGRMAGTNQTYISLLEAGEINVTFNKLCRIAEALEVEVSDLVR